MGTEAGDTTEEDITGDTTASALLRESPRPRLLLNGMDTEHTTAPTTTDTATTASAPLMLSPRLRPLLNGMDTEAGDTTEDGEAGTHTTASAPLRESPRPIPRLT